MIHWTEALNACSPRWIDLAWAIVWQSTLAAAGVAAAATLVPKSAPTWRHWLWQLMAIKLLLMPFWTMALIPQQTVETKLEVGRTIKLPANARPNQTRRPADFAGQQNARRPAVHSVVSRNDDAFRSVAEPSSVARHTEWLNLRWQSWLCLGWLVVVAGQLLRWWWLRRRLGALLRRATPADSAVADLVSELAVAMGLRRKPLVLFTDPEVSPFVCGVWRTALVLPRGLAAALKPAQLRLVVLHELAKL